MTASLRPASPAREIFVLIQAKPRVEVLAVSSDQERLLAEAETLYDQHGESGDAEHFAWHVQPVGAYLNGVDASRDRL